MINNVDYYKILNEGKFIKKRKLSNFFVENADANAEIGYRDESVMIMKFLMQGYCRQVGVMRGVGYFGDKNKELAYFRYKYLILICKYSEEEALITNIIGRIRRSNLFKIKLYRPS